MTENQLKVALAVIVLALTMAIWLIEGPNSATNPTKPTPTVTDKAPRITPKTKAEPAATPKPRIKRTHRVNRSVVRGYKFTVQTNTPSKRYAQTLVNGTQWPCLHELWMRESGWSPTSDNLTSSAYGIPQILGLQKRTGDDYRKQVQAGLGYILHRYGTPCEAWSFWRAHRWY